MKHIALILSITTLLSCSPFHSPESSERDIIRNEIHPRKIETVIGQVLDSGKDLTVYASPKGPEALEFLSYVIPVLHEQGDLSLRLWFLKNNSDSEVKAFLEGEDGAYTASDLLRRANPVLGGFMAYETFLLNLKSFYNNLEDSESLKISSSDNVILDFRLYDGTFKEEAERNVYLIHSPLPDGRRWEFPFQGILYSMMIHEWPLREYSAIDISGNYLGSSYLTERDADENRTASELIDGLFLMSFPREYIPMTRIESFVTEENISEVLSFFPRQLIREKTKPASYLVNRKIKASHKKAVRSLKRMYESILEEIPGNE